MAVPRASRSPWHPTAAGALGLDLSLQSLAPDPRAARLADQVIVLAGGDDRRRGTEAARPGFPAGRAPQQPPTGQRSLAATRQSRDPFHPAHEARHPFTPVLHRSAPAGRGADAAPSPSPRSNPTRSSGSGDPAPSGALRHLASAARCRKTGPSTLPQDGLSHRTISRRLRALRADIGSRGLAPSPGTDPPRWGGRLRRGHPGSRRWGLQCRPHAIRR
jgi:hypothetical protein